MQKILAHSALIAGWLILPCLAAHAEHRSYSSYEGYKTCKICHQGEFDSHAADIMASLHWTWEQTDAHTGKAVGKINVINNYCVAVPSNEPRCTSCHIGIGWADKTFNKANADAIDCLACHDNTGTYKKLATGAGQPVAGLDYPAIFRSLTPMKADRLSCGACHFYGGGADAVKHGSLDSTMGNPTRALDVHMGVDGMNMQCTACHVPNKDKPHEIVGSRYSKSATDDSLCQRCHTAAPHKDILDAHVQRVACQTCHIPAYARGGIPTKMYWDWSTAGRKVDGQLVKEYDADGNVIYDTMKGTFTWQENVIPDYVWFNGNVTHVTLDDPVMQGQIVKINELHGDVDDPNARIFPVKRFTGRQPYDVGRGTLAIPKLFPPTNPSAYWNNYDWATSLTAGMAYVGETFTGPVGYVDTEMLWIQNHMVAPKEQALKCVDCHTFGARINFTRLGYPPAEAAQLQLMMGGTWFGYPVLADMRVNTMAWLGVVNVMHAPYIYVYNIGEYLYIPENAAAASGGWAYFYK